MSANLFVYNLISKAKPVLNKVLPLSIRAELSKMSKTIQKSALKEMMSSNTARERTGLINSLLLEGVNIIGYARSPVGIGESVRGMASALTEAGVPFEIIDYEDYLNHPDANKKNEGMFGYNTNIFHINHGDMREAAIRIDADKWRGRRNIGYWAWELAEFPDQYSDCFQLLDEVWVGSEFVRMAVAAKSPIPVTLVPYCLHLPYLDESLTRDGLNLPKHAFLFLNMFDLKSLSERKNPKAAIDAFRKAFEPSDLSVGMVIKVKRDPSTLKEIQALKAEISDAKNIFIIEEILSREGINSLLMMVDAAVSLHRSEGFGLLMAEAMYFGKPVIGTNWSGNVDFMNADNSCPVDYKLVKIKKDCGPFKAGQEWAEADTDHAAQYMRRLVCDSEYYHKIGELGMATMRQMYSPKVVGELCRNRLIELGVIKEEKN